MKKLKRYKMLFWCRECNAYFEAKPTREMIEIMKEKGVDTWIEERYCTPCFHKVSLQDAQDESK